MGLRIHFVVDPHGWCCMGLIVFVWLYNIVLIPKIVLFPHYEEGHIPGILIIIFYGISIFCLVALVRASITDPGRLPENPKIPHGEREFWELCNKCNLMRPKRSHHCSRCGHCVRRMDHHCPWINNCVGEDNHWLFLQLCFYTELLTCYALMFSFCHYYYFLPLKKRNLDLFVFRHELAIMRLAAFMGITMLVGITGLFYTQLIGIITDTTSIEKMSNCCEDIVAQRSQKIGHLCCGETMVQVVRHRAVTEQEQTACYVYTTALEIKLCCSTARDSLPISSWKTLVHPFGQFSYHFLEGHFP
ncbi:palmitoyltransferase ZDHHC21 isoform X1 [Pan troglodytes]|uniref:palmitoyltransferase ZDHHC21 isoform X1 n=1 Tax=Pan troglodytes TaxID=9598 RepID=UPI0007DBE648|nr:palmitoyltransferase ZDHHC21 isoform X1 [Pan troglodytes]XP_016816104.1 palmitoyltransferase ZDHHC21 isoform X1 [Pan troglodytes]XP_016816105.1 palmitoyltransferase ZDHHC21 isoform X1 [Pan troglodytes]XP_016816108.1 palmitoyltransferase ZDHHC21 isoform X1 [Pan troglodytes]XP_054513920.1 palmitoyltransferase ZDHHC21 isoform X1 [Pan troglodytes]